MTTPTATSSPRYPGSLVTSERLTPITAGTLDPPRLLDTPIPSHHRLSLAFPHRLLFASLTASSVGFFLGATLGARKAALIFRAENAHRTPNSQKGWYFYHKTKNYKTMLGGCAQGIKSGAQMGAWVAMFMVFEDAVDRLRGRIDALGSVVAGLGGAGVFSAWNRFGYGLTVRTAKKGLVLGAGFGVAQDVLRWGKGQRGNIFEGLGGASRNEVVEVRI